MIIDTEFNSAADIPAKICVDAAVLAEERGFGGVWKGESNSRDPLVLLTAVGARTSRIRLGTAIYHVYGRSPVTLGIQAAAFNEVTDGRLILGLGVGNPVIAGWHGGEFDRPLARMREYVEILRAVYSGERVPDIEGEFYSTQGGFKLAFQQPHPLTVHIAGLGPQMSRMAGKLSDGIVLNLASPPMIEEIVDGFREGAREAGRRAEDLEVVAKLRVSLHEDADRARAALRKVLTFYSLQRGYSDMLRKMGWGSVVDRVQETHRSEGFAAARAVVPGEMIDGVPMYAGSSLDGLPAKLEQYRDAGVTRCIVAYVPAGDEIRSEVENFVAQASFVEQFGG